MNGKIEEVVGCEMMIPTEMQYMGNGLLLVVSKVYPSVNVVDIRRK